MIQGKQSGNKMGLGPSPNMWGKMAGVPRGTSTQIPGNKRNPAVPMQPSAPWKMNPQMNSSPLFEGPQTGMGINRPFMGRGPSPTFGLQSPPQFNPGAMNNQMTGMNPSPNGMQELMQRMGMRNTGMRNPMMGM